MYIIAIDQGTTGTTVSILNHGGGLVAKANLEFPQVFPKPGWVEHNPEEIWKSVVGALKTALEQGHVNPQDIAGIGITNQRETVVVWDKNTGAPIYNAIVWQCRRTQDFCEQLKKQKKNKVISKKTGLVVDPYFSASKIRWILKNVSGAQARARKGELLCGTIDAYLVWRLSGGITHKTDVSNASRTMLMNIHSGEWDPELLKIFDVPKEMLPQVENSSGDFGQTRGLGVLPDGVRIAGVAGDQQSALFGQACFQPGEAKCTFGTGSFLLLNTGEKAIPSKHQLLTTVAWRLPKKKMVYALEGGAFVCGAAVQWLRDGLGLIQSSAEIENLARQVDQTDGVEFVPALTGLGAPHWRPEARGLWSGLTRGTTKAHIARATLEAMALQNVDILLAMQKDLGKRLRALKVDGGAAANNLLMQMQADFMGMNVTRPQYIETTSIGAAYLAGLGVGFWDDISQIQKIWKVDQEFKVAMAAKDRMKRLDSWNHAVGMLKN